jgi:hypothetical protein
MTTPEEKYHQLSEAMPGSLKSQMFGKPCYKVNGKAFVCFFQDCMVFKLPPEAVKTALELKDAILFDPSGKNRPMKQWVQLNFENEVSWEHYASLAFNYVTGA